MEMNFPHNSLAGTSSETDENTIRLRDALLNPANGRSVLSDSARAFIACGGVINDRRLFDGSSWMDQRIKFFGGGAIESKPAGNEATFLRGNFRPDLARENGQRPRFRKSMNRPFTLAIEDIENLDV